MNYLSQDNAANNTPTLIDIATLFKMIDCNQAEQEECKRVTESVYRGDPYPDFNNPPKKDASYNPHMAWMRYILYQDAKTEGFIMNNIHGTIIQQARSNSYYRGENQIFPKSIPSLMRRLSQIDNAQDRAVYKFVANMRIQEFSLFIDKLGSVVDCWKANGLTVLYELLAQHYGFETQWLDITSNLNVALFFATCKWDNQLNEWRPLTKSEVDQHQYGVIFHKPEKEEQMDQMFYFMNKDYIDNPSLCPALHKNYTPILPVGYQPFMRCHSQQAYAMRFNQFFPLQKDQKFEELRFPHSVKLSELIFDFMQGGKLIYPQEGLDIFTSQLAKMSKATEFSREVFLKTLAKDTFFKDEQTCLKALSSSTLFCKPITVYDGTPHFQPAPKKLKQFKRVYQNFNIEDFFNIKLQIRLAAYVP